MRQAFRIPFREFAFNDDILAFQIAEFGELSKERRDEKIISTRVNPVLMGCSARGERPRYRRAADERDECATLHLLPFEKGRPSSLRPTASGKSVGGLVPNNALTPFGSLVCSTIRTTVTSNVPLRIPPHPAMPEHRLMPPTKSRKRLVCRMRTRNRSTHRLAARHP